MSIIIKGMEMPKSPRECRFYDTDPFGIRKPFCAIQSVCNGLSDCPLIEIPPHGRLIDADALSYHRAFGEDDSHDFVRRYTIELAPTIIEAEEEE